jgi:hypothetical protein
MPTRAAFTLGRPIAFWRWALYLRDKGCGRTSRVSDVGLRGLPRSEPVFLALNGAVATSSWRSSTRLTKQDGESRSELLRAAAIALLEARKVRRLKRRLVDAYSRMPQDPVLVETARRLAAEAAPDW